MEKKFTLAAHCWNGVVTPRMVGLAWEKQMPTFSSHWGHCLFSAAGLATCQIPWQWSISLCISIPSTLLCGTAINASEQPFANVGRNEKLVQDLGNCSSVQVFQPLDHVSKKVWTTQAQGQGGRDPSLAQSGSPPVVKAPQPSHYCASPDFDSAQIEFQNWRSAGWAQGVCGTASCSCQRVLDACCTMCHVQGLLFDHFSDEPAQLFNTTLKTHDLIHLALLSHQINPRVVWNFCGESYMGILKLLGANCVKGVAPQDACTKMLHHRSYGMHCEMQKKWSEKRPACCGNSGHRITVGIRITCRNSKWSEKRPACCLNSGHRITVGIRITCRNRITFAHRTAWFFMYLEPKLFGMPLVHCFFQHSSQLKNAKKTMKNLHF